MLTACFGARRKTGRKAGGGARSRGCCVIAATGRSLLAAAAMTLAACATQDGADLGGGLYDPVENVNRATFEFNNGVDEAIGEPIAMAYREALPRGVRDGIRNFADNLNSPVILINNLLQGEFGRAQVTLARFVVNSTAGIGGVADVAARAGLPGRRADFGETLAAWGVGPGPYLVVPFLGPSTTRHFLGRVADVAVNPIGYLLAATDYAWVGLVERTVGIIDQRERLIEAVDGLKKTSLDFYASARSSYWQARLAKIHNGRILPGAPGDDDIDIDDYDEPAPKPVAALPKPGGTRARNAAINQ